MTRASISAFILCCVLVSSSSFPQVIQNALNFHHKESQVHFARRANLKGSGNLNSESNAKTASDTAGSSSGQLRSGGFDPKTAGITIPAILVMASKLIDTYSLLLTTNPFPTKVLTLIQSVDCKNSVLSLQMISSAIVGGLGDILIQKIQMRNTNKSFDYRRLLVFSLVAGLYIAPVIHVWFDWLDKLPFLQSMTGFNKAAIMMLIDQTIGATVINMFFFVAFETVRYSIFIIIIIMY